MLYRSMRSSICSLALTFAILAPTLGAQDTTHAPTPGRIRGRVLEDSTGKPIVGAEVLLPKLAKSVRTDSAGRYDFAGLAPESTTVFVRALGYLPDSTVVAVRNRVIISLELRLAY